jgi:hypothetical protein
MTLFKKNYLYELPDDIQSTIYKLVFDRCVYDIQNNKNIKYLNRLYCATNNPNNTCIYHIIPKGLFSTFGEEYKYKDIISQDIIIKDMKDMKYMKDIIYLDRSHLIENTAPLHINTISFYLYPLFISNKSLKKYLTIRFNLIKFYKEELIHKLVVVEDRVNVIFTQTFKCNADIYYNIMVGYNVIYNSLSNIIYSEDNAIMFNKFVEIFRWIEANNILEGYNINNQKIIPIFEGLVKN